MNIISFAPRYASQEPSSPLRRRSHTYPPNKVSSKNNDSQMDMVIDSMSTLTVEQPTQKPPRPSYSPTPHSLNIHGSDFSIRRRRRISGDWSPTPATTTPAPPDISRSFAAPGSISHDTPMIKKAAYWGSQPNGRDWGSTVKAEAENIGKITRWLDDSDAVYRASGEFGRKHSDYKEGAPLPLVRSNTLTFDGEEDEDEEEQDSFGIGELPAMGGDHPAKRETTAFGSCLSRNVSMGRRRSSIFRKER